MRMRKMAVFGILAASMIVPAQAALAQSSVSETTVVVMPEEYQLRVLEEQIQMLRHKLYMKQKMTDAERKEWNKQYQDVTSRLKSWNKFTDEYTVQ